MKFRSAIPIAALALVTAMSSADAAMNDYTRSASWTSCRLLGTSPGQRSIRGLLARQWIVGYASGIIAVEGLADRAKPLTADSIMIEVRRYCRQNPDAMAVDAAESIIGPRDHTR